jgi:hypothetical protein
MTMSDLDISLQEIDKGIEEAIEHHTLALTHLRRLRLKVAQTRGPRPSPLYSVFRAAVDRHVAAEKLQREA